MGRLFGTDGIRGIANTELSCELALRLGRAAAKAMPGLHPAENGRRARILIGMDTRASSAMLASALAAGFNSAGVDVICAGVTPTPAAAHLISRWHCGGGAMVSASHNPCEYNGIKLFQANGFKLPDALEEQIEALLLDETELPPGLTGGQVGRAQAREEEALAVYLHHLCATVPSDLAAGLRAQGIIRRVALDCANGAASMTAQKLFFDLLGFEGDMISFSPDGENINAGCGSTHVERLRDFVRSGGYDAGFAFDGDADRVLAVDETGALVDGDKIIAVCAKQMQREGKLRRGSAVVTVMSNLGFHAFCRKNGIACEVTGVGDRYVLERMNEKGFNLGGEQSGHIIFSDHASTGDGQLTALQLLDTVRKAGKPLSTLANEMELFPQVLVNVRVSSLGKLRCASDADVRAAVTRAEAELGEEGRVLVRVSGTEPLVRVMLEGKDAARIQVLAEEIAGVISERLL
ncbi:MAG: phosphoglucosamine mutase [Oscillospiraceae bacterium]|jgi:phosphoglucosamine mutase|nr:phosphoglucosamine mutase [Oscillospiraceae bacterium]